MNEIINRLELKRLEYLGIKPIIVRDWIKKAQAFPLTKPERSGSSNFLNYMHGSKAEKMLSIALEGRI